MKRISARLAGKEPEDNLATPAKRLRVSSQKKTNISDSRPTTPAPPSHLKSQMNRLNKQQKDQVKNFVQWTQSNEATAIACLQKCGWNTEIAVDMFYNNPQLAAQAAQQPQLIDKYKLEGMFNTYANDPRDTDVGPRRIGPNGMMRLLTDMHLDPADRRVLILACKLKAQTQCEFSWEEFQQGLTHLRCDSVDSLRQSLDQLDSNMTDQTAFRELYNFTFAYGKPAGQRSMALDHALAYWKILFKDLFPLLDTWEEFLVTEHGKGISKDTWHLLLDFCYTIKPDLSNYDDDGAWPVLIDQFVDYARNKMAQTAA